MDLSDNSWRAGGFNVPLPKALKARSRYKKVINAIMLPSQNFVIKCMSPQMTLLLVIKTPA